MKQLCKLFVLLLPLVILLSGCGATEPITTDPSGIWNWFVYLLAQMIVQLGYIFGNNIGWGLVCSTLIVRCIMIPLYSQQNKATENMNYIQPEIKKYKRNPRVHLRKIKQHKCMSNKRYRHYTNSMV